MTLGTAANQGAASVNTISVADSSQINLTVEAGFTGDLTVNLDSGIEPGDATDTVDASARSTGALTVNANLGSVGEFDTLKGGKGASDTLNLVSSDLSNSANFTHGSGFETINVTGSGDDATIIVGSAEVVDTGKTLTVNAQTLTADFTFDGSAETSSVGDFVVNSGSGDDSLTGGDGNDTLRGGAGNDFLHGGASGTNVLEGGAGDDEIIGGNFRDTITAGDDDDYAESGDGNDIIDMGAGDDTVNMQTFDGEGAPAATSVLSYEDIVDGGAGTNDALLVNHDVNDLDLMNTVNVEVLDLRASDLTANLGSEANGGGSGRVGGGIKTVIGSSGTDTINVLAGFTERLQLILQRAATTRLTPMRRPRVLLRLRRTLPISPAAIR